MGRNNTCYRDITSFLSLLLSFTTGFSVSPPASWASNRSTNSSESCWKSRCCEPGSDQKKVGLNRGKPGNSPGYENSDG
jgi:hypothetical protein